MVSTLQQDEAPLAPRRLPAELLAPHGRGTVRFVCTQWLALWNERTK